MGQWSSYCGWTRGLESRANISDGSSSRKGSGYAYALARETRFAMTSNSADSSSYDDDALGETGPTCSEGTLEQA